jgi:hypothetical protein
MSTTENAAHSQWTGLCDVRDWTFEEQVRHLEGFLHERGLFVEFAAYATKAALEETGDVRMHTLESVGYTIARDAGDPTRWHWRTSEWVSDWSFDSEDEAFNAAWKDAAERTVDRHGLTRHEWDGLSVYGQVRRIEQALRANDQHQRQRC